MPDDKPADIEFDCIVVKVQTLADSGVRVWLDLPEDAVIQAAQLIDAQRNGDYLKVRMVAHGNHA